MSLPTADTFNRTVKLVLDSGRASDEEAARQFLESLVLQVDVGASIAGDPAAEAALATVVNTGHRAFLGGVAVRVSRDVQLRVGWLSGLTLNEAVTRLGGQIVHDLEADRPTIAIARPADPIGVPVLQLAAHGWAGGVFTAMRSTTVGGAGTAPAGVVGAALGVSELFQQALGNVVAGRRDVGVSLWRPDLSWLDPEAAGPPLLYLPADLWLLGLGHLGQGYAWVLGLLPYATPSEAIFRLVDFDRVVDGNFATQLLVKRADVGQLKTRVVARELESIGFGTRIVERAFDSGFRPDPMRGAPGEPLVALAGFDKPEPRQLEGGNRFRRVVDGGLGAGPAEYLDLIIHTFPSPLDPETEFVRRARRTGGVLAKPYEAELERLVAAGVDHTVARCGILDVAGVTVGAAFVGAFTGSLVVGDILRLLHGGRDYSVVSADLRQPSGVRAVVNSAPGERFSPTYTAAAACPNS